MPAREPTILPSELAQLFDVDERTIRNWARLGCPQRMRSKRPMYVLSEVIAWRRQRDRVEASSADRPDLAQEQARKLRADADLAELKVQERRGDLVPAANVEQQMERVCLVLRSRVLSMRGRWAPRLIGLGSMIEAATVVDQLTTELLDSLLSAADELDRDGDLGENEDEESEGEAT